MPAALTTNSVSIRPALGQHGGHPPAAGPHPGRGHALDDPDAELPRALGQRGGHAHRVGPALVSDVEGRQHVVGAGQRPHVRELARARSRCPRRRSRASRRPRGAAPPAAAGWWPARCARRAEAGGVPGLRLQPGVQVTRVPAEEQRVSSVMPAEVISPAACHVVPRSAGAAQAGRRRSSPGGPGGRRCCSRDPAADDDHLGSFWHGAARGIRLHRHDAPSLACAPGAGQVPSVTRRPAGVQCQRPHVRESQGGPAGSLLLCFWRLCLIMEAWSRKTF